MQLVRIQLRVPEYGWTTQKVFHLMNFVVNGCKCFFTHCFLLFDIDSTTDSSQVPIDDRVDLAVRAVTFGLYKSVFLIRPKVLLFRKMNSFCTAEGNEYMFLFF